MTDFLPVDNCLPELRAALAEAGQVVLEAPPGAGKTTRVPLALMEEPWLEGRGILMLQPRRIAARSTAAWMAKILGEAVGQRVGYRVRFDNQVSHATRIEVVTEGILTRRLQQDPELDGVGLVIFDEFHERNLNTDLGLALVQEVQEVLRPELRLLIMSATLEGFDFDRHFPKAPRVSSAGRQHEIRYRYETPRREEDRETTVVRTIQRALREEGGDLLVFLPGQAEIRRCMRALEGTAGVEILPLFGDLPKSQQERIFQPGHGGRRLILATNIAETSLTIPGIRVVVDSGWCRVPRFDPRSGLTRLETQRISQASARQRAGRAGRLGPGVCYRCWAEGQGRQFLVQQPPEILEADLSGLLLQLAQWGTTNPQALHWFDAPPAGSLAQARDLLIQLDALDTEGRITQQGLAMAALPLHPRLAHMLVRARSEGLAYWGGLVAALISERDPFRGLDTVDLMPRVEALDRALRQGRAGELRQLTRATHQLLRLVAAETPAMPMDEGELGYLVALAYPDRVAQASGSVGRFRLRDGGAARLSADDPLSTQPLLAIAHVGGSARDTQVRLAITLDETGLHRAMAAQVQGRDEIRWDGREQRVVSCRVERLGALVLKESPLHTPDPQRVTQALLQGIRELGLACLPWNEAAKRLRERVQALGRWRPQPDWPDLSEAALLDSLETWLAPYLDGFSRIGQVQRLDLEQILRNRLDWPQQQQLEEGAPERLTVPSGSQIRLQYPEGEVPILAVKLQELFGLAETPRVAWGQVPVLLHLLNPAGRPIQVTRDLASFWNTTYPEVCKELKGRYPKHPWPADPWSATATAKTKRHLQKG